MSKLVLTNVRLLAAGADLSGDTNEATISATVEAKDTTSFNSAGWKESIGGLRQAVLVGNGFWEAGSTATGQLPDDTFFANLGLATGYQIAPNGAADQALVYFTNAINFKYEIFGKVGDVAPFSTEAQSTWPLVRGLVGLPPASVLTTTGTGTINQLGAVAAGQSIYADLQVLSVQGTSTPTITVTIQSAALVGFGSPTTRLTFTGATATGDQILRAAGPITDQFWRVAYTITGSSPIFQASVAYGIA